MNRVAWCRFPLPALAVLVLSTGCGSSSEVVADDAAVHEIPVDAPSEVPADIPAETAIEDATDGEIAPVDAPEDDAQPGDVATDTDAPRPPDPAMRLRNAGWLSGDLHQHTTYSDGEDPVRVAVRIAEYLRDPAFLAFHPEYEGNAIDFAAITDHRTVDQNADPDFHSDSLVLIPGEEFGGPGHAGIWGLSAFVSHDPGGDGSTLEDYAGGVDAAHAQGALFAMNHPMIPGHLFGWDLRHHDAIEVWNTRWLLQGMTFPEDQAAWEAAHGPISPFASKAIGYQDDGGGGQVLRFYEAQLALGIHVALVGGSDRHVLFPVGFPSTWVKAATRDMAGVLDGIRARHTFVTRSPVSATVELSMQVDGTAYEMGDEVPIPPGGADVVVTCRVTRATGARVRLVRGGRVATEADLPAATLGQVAFEATADDDDYEAAATLSFQPGDWLYPVVHQPMIAPGLDPALAAQAQTVAGKASQYSDENYAPIIEALLPYMDTDVVLAPEMCDPADWIASDLQCMTADDNGMATFFLPDWIDRILNGVVEGGQASSWSMGAVGSAVRFVARPE